MLSFLKGKGGGTIDGPRKSPASAVWDVVKKPFDKNEKELTRLRPVLEQVNALGPRLKSMDDDELRALGAELKRRFRELVTQRLRERGADWREPTSDPLGIDQDYERLRRAVEKGVLAELMPETFALTREVSERTIGLRHYDVQILGGAVLHSGRIAEMKTGEGKTLVASLPVVLNALTGRGVHVVTVNDYLAERDANWMRPIYEFLGLTVAFITNNSAPEERKVAYHGDVLYATNSEVGFDYLRDNMATDPDWVVQRPLNFAIVDEVDNILIDEARTPLIISAQVEQSERAQRKRRHAKVLDGVARKLVPAISDREVEDVIARFKQGNQLDVDGLYNFLLDRGCLQAGLTYFIASYVRPDSPARAENVAKLLALVDELVQLELSGSQLTGQLRELATQTTTGTELAEVIAGEVGQVVTPFAETLALVLSVITQFTGDRDSQMGASLAVLQQTLHIHADFLETVEDRMRTRADEDGLRYDGVLAVVEEMARRGWVDEDVTTTLTEAVFDLEPAEAARAFWQRASEVDGNLARALELAEELRADDPEVTRRVAMIEEISTDRLLPHDACERLWQLVRIRLPHEELIKRITTGLQNEPGPNTHTLHTLVTAFGKQQQLWLKERSESLRLELNAIPGLSKSGVDNLTQQARAGAGAEDLRRALRQELYRFAPNSEALKVVRQFIQQRALAMEQLGASLLRELDELIELPKESRRQMMSILATGGHADSVRADLHALVSDLPDESREAERVVAHAVDELVRWREDHGDALADELVAVAPGFPIESQTAVATAVHDGRAPEALESVVGEELLKLPANAAIARLIVGFSDEWDDWLARQIDRALDEISATVPLGDDLRDLLQDDLAQPLNPAELGHRCVAHMVGEVIGRHLEPLLTPESAVPFCEELRRRLPLEKKLTARLRPEPFAGRNQEQLLRAALRLVDETLRTVPIEDLPRLVKSYGWFCEKDEKHHAAGILDMGTLIAEQEIGQSAFPDPEDFLTVLVENQVLREEEAAQVAQAMAASGQSQASLVVPRVIALEPARRRKLAELKMQEVQSVLDQSIRAHALYHKNIHYVIEGGDEIVIVDEFTGRKMPGRRWSDGLHEAVEAKERVEVRLESQTVATVTIQNYFRLYHKLAGMTGTAKTEEAEFVKTYGLEVVSIPTNRTVRRTDYQDVIFKTAEAKTRSIVFELLEHHCQGQPVLVGTRSVEVSERLSERLKALPLQTLCLTQLIKFKLWEAKQLDKQTKADLVGALNAPLTQLNVAAVRGIAKDQGLDPDVTRGENLHEIKARLNLTEAELPQLEAALRGGIPHNVLNAKNHRNEARIVAEAARVGAVTIATNMAGRGVDILLGGTLDNEAKLRLITRRIVARHLRGETSRVRSRTVETTEQLQERLAPPALQQLVWIATVEERLAALQQNRELDLATAKEIRDAYATALAATDLRNRVRARARRLNLSDRLPLDDDALNDERLRQAHRMFGVETASVEQLRRVLEAGVASQSFQHDPRDTLLLRALFRLAAQEDERVVCLLQELTSLPDLDRALMETVAASGSLAAEQLALEIQRRQPRAWPVSATWIADRLEAFAVSDASAAQRWLAASAQTEVEFNDSQILQAVRARLTAVEADRAWLQQKLRRLNVVRSERRYPTGDDSVLTHLRVERDALQRLAQTLNGANQNGSRGWSNSEERWQLTDSEVPFAAVYEFLRRESGQAVWATPEWLETRMRELGLREARAVQSSEGVEVLLRLRPQQLLEQLDARLAEAAVRAARAPRGGGDPVARIAAELLEAIPEAAPWVNEDWVTQRLRERGLQLDREIPVLIETGVSGQAADWVLVGEQPPEVAEHTSEYDEVRRLGGLHIIGTERHESRRIDNQLRGRAGRQGDPGSSRFYVSLEDELWRLFGVRGQWLLNQWQEDEQVEARLITKQIENAQKKVEMNHFESRKHTLQYDDVMNVQREAIYKMRRRALVGVGLRDTLLAMIADQVKWLVNRHCPPQLPPEDWDLRRLHQASAKLFGMLRPHDYLREAELHSQGRDEIQAALTRAVTRAYEDREQEIGPEHMRELERYWICESVDEYWMQHLAEMELLREGISLRGWGQREPLVEYRKEAYDMFVQMMGNLQNDTISNLMSVPADAAKEWAGRRLRNRVSSMRYQWAETATPDAAAEAETYTHGQIKAGRNDPCPCGSGKKYKRCCLKKERRGE